MRVNLPEERMLRRGLVGILAQIRSCFCRMVKKGIGTLAINSAGRERQ